jgi:hypothetical protein
MAAITACAPTAKAERANSINAGPRHVSFADLRRKRRASSEFGTTITFTIKICVCSYVITWKNAAQRWSRLTVTVISQERNFMVLQLHL